MTKCFNTKSRKGWGWGGGGESEILLGGVFNG